MELSLEQRHIVDAPISSHMRIIAGAGCAKTTTLTRRIAKVVRELESAHIQKKVIAMTFTRIAAAELAHKLETLGCADNVIVGTIDSVALTIIREYAPDMCSICDTVSEYKLAWLAFLRRGNKCRARKTFTDSIYAVFVDEFQDITPVYYDVLKAFADSGSYITGVGDVYQSIYGFSGASPQYLSHYTTYFPGATAYTLTTNYRSSHAILHLANKLLEIMDADFRLNASPTFEEHPLLSGYPPYSAHVYDSSQSEVEHLMKSLNALPKDVSVTILARNSSRIIPRITNELRDTPHIQVYDTTTCMTIHKGKGGGWDVVYVVDISDQVFPSYDALMNEELQLLYVAITRAKHAIHFSGSCSRSKSQSQFMLLLTTLIEKNCEFTLPTSNHNETPSIRKTIKAASSCYNNVSDYLDICEMLPNWTCEMHGPPLEIDEHCRTMCEDAVTLSMRRFSDDAHLMYRYVDDSARSIEGEIERIASYRGLLPSKLKFMSDLYTTHVNHDAFVSHYKCVRNATSARDALRSSMFVVAYLKKYDSENEPGPSEICHLLMDRMAIYDKILSGGRFEHRRDLSHKGWRGHISTCVHGASFHAYPPSMIIFDTSVETEPESVPTSTKVELSIYLALNRHQMTHVFLCNPIYGWSMYASTTNWHVESSQKLIDTVFDETRTHPHAKCQTPSSDELINTFYAKKITNHGIDVDFSHIV